jgi:hypothetical protein
MPMLVFWVVKSCELVGFGETYCIQLQGSSEDGGSMFLRDASIYLQIHTASLPRRKTTTPIMFCRSFFLHFPKLLMRNLNRVLSFTACDDEKRIHTPATCEGFKFASTRPAVPQHVLTTRCKYFTVCFIGLCYFWYL